MRVINNTILKNYLISIIIPTYNRIDLLERALNSVVNQTYKNWEIIVVDNNSTNKIDKLIKRYSEFNIKLFKINNNGVIAASRNLGIKNSKGNLIAFLDSDDWWKPKKLYSSIEIFTKYQNIDLVYHNCILTSTYRKKNSHCRNLKENKFQDLVINGNTIITSSVVIKKDCIKNAIFFSEKNEIIGWEDYHLWLKLAMLKKEFFFIKENLGYYWYGENNHDNPKQIIKNTGLIYDIIIKPFLTDNPQCSVWWINYTRGLAYLNLKDKKNSFRSFRDVIIKSSPVSKKIKSLFYIFFSILRL